MKTILIVMLVSIGTGIFAQTQDKYTTNYVITKAYCYVNPDSANDITNQFITKVDSGVVMMIRSFDSKGTFVVDSGKNKIAFFGNFEEIERNDSVGVLYDFDYVNYDSADRLQAVFMKRYTEGSFEKTGKREYYFIVNFGGYYVCFMTYEGNTYIESASVK